MSERTSLLLFQNRLSIHLKKWQRFLEVCHDSVTELFTYNKLDEKAQAISILKRVTELILVQVPAPKV